MTHDATGSREQPQLRPGAGQTAPRVLVVDDEEPIRIFADRVLREGVDIRFASG